MYNNIILKILFITIVLFSLTGCTHTSSNIVPPDISTTIEPNISTTEYLINVLNSIDRVVSDPEVVEIAQIITGGEETIVMTKIAIDTSVVTIEVFNFFQEVYIALPLSR